MIEVTEDLLYFIKERVEKLLIHGRTTQKTTSKVISKYEVNDEEERILVGIETHTTTETIMDDTPDFILKHILDSLNFEVAYKLLKSKGYMVIDPTVKEETSNQISGVSEKTLLQIKKQLLELE
jgi:HD superfamily phosphohydrolase YqeK